jgi:uncharacterized Fe-S cluster-containing radical SAM superfamily protein
MRILCLGNNTEDTDVRTRQLSQGAAYHGLLSELDNKFPQYSLSGWYHSSIFDLAIGKLLEICNQFDKVIVLDQTKSSYNHPDAFLNTVKIGIEVGAEFENPKTKELYNYWTNVVTTNKSFCIFPFIELQTNYDHTTVCCRSMKPITFFSSLVDYKTDPNYNNIRQQMLAGKMLPEHCAVCYRYESMGITSARQQETIEWANRLNLDTLIDLDKIIKPVYYEIRANNKCNLACRMCNPEDSSKVKKLHEYLEWIPRNTQSQKNSQGFDIVDLDLVHKLYVSGGEPTIMTELYEFLEKCITLNRLDFEILINTNGTKLTNRFRSLIKHFKNLQFVLSLDGYGELNDFIRPPSQWSKVIDNWKYLISQGHKVSVNTTVSIYNINKLDELFNYIDSFFPNTLIHCQTVDTKGVLSPMNSPLTDEVLQAMIKIKSLPCYNNDKLFASFIDGVINHYQTRKTYDVALFKKFSDYDYALSLGLAFTGISGRPLYAVNPLLASYQDV